MACAYRGVGTASAVLALLTCQAGLAQTAPPASSQDAPATQGNVGAPTDAAAPGAGAANGTVASGDIIVTAQRRSESLQRTPVAVSVVGAEALRDKVIASQADLQSAVPGLQVKASQSSDQLNYAIRGQSLDPFSSVRPGVLPYFDEVQVGGSGSAAFYDLQSVQVLKGPQGTLFGRNATGGAVLVTSTKPEDRFGGYISGRLGNYNLMELEGALNVPLVQDKVLLRVAGLIERRDGFQFNLFDRSRVGDVDRSAIRGSLTLKPSARLADTLVVDYLHSGGSSTSNVIYSIFAPGQQGPGATIAPVPANVLFSPGVDAIFGPGSFARYLAVHPGADPDGIIAFTAKQKARGPFLIDVDGANSHLANNLIVSNITTYDLADNTQIKNVFGFTRLKSLDRAEFDGSPFGIDTLGPQGLRQNLRQISEEIQLIGKLGPLSYVGGFYYSNEKLDYFSESIIFDLRPLLPLSDQFNHSITTNETLAPYAQGTLDLSHLTGINGLGVTAGVRYTDETVRIVRQPDDIYIAHPQPGFVLDPQSASNRKISYQFGIQEQLQNVLLYAVTRRSFRSGGFNSIAPPLPGFGNEGGSEYRPEIATDVEVGAKFRGNIAGAPLRFNIAGYDMWVSDIQRVTYALIRGTPSAITVNVPKAEITGVEADVTITPAHWLDVGGSVAYAYGRFTSNLVQVAGGAPVAFGPYPDLPRVSGTAFAQITVPVQGDISASLRGDMYGQTKTYFSSAQRALNPGAVIPGYVLADFRLAIENKKTGWSLSANVKNAFNRVYYVGGLPFESVFALNAAVPGPPRTFLVQAGYRF